MITLRVVEPEPVKLEVKNAVLNLNAPDVIDLTVTPSTTQQVFEHEGHDGYDTVTVQGAPLQSKRVTPSAQAQTVSADSGYYGLSSVSVGVVEGENPSGMEYVYYNRYWDKKKVVIDATNFGKPQYHQNNLYYHNRHFFGLPFGIVEEVELRSDTEFFIRGDCENMFGDNASYAQNTPIKKITMPRANTSYAVDVWNMFSFRKKLEEIDCVFDLSGISSENYMKDMFRNCESLREIRFKPNTIKHMKNQIFNVSQLFSDETIVSIANGIKDGVTQYNSLQFLSTPKAKCLSITGIVSLDETQTYHIFTADPSGDTTLADFITVTKGWTLA